MKYNKIRQGLSKQLIINVDFRNFMNNMTKKYGHVQIAILKDEMKF